MEKAHKQDIGMMYSVDSHHTTIPTLLPPSHIVAQVETEAMMYGLLSDDGVIPTYAL